MGGLLAGVEHRIAAFVLMSGDGGDPASLVEHLQQLGLSMESGPDRSSGPLKAWLATMRPIEPLTWVKRASSPLLFLSGRRDQLVSRRAAVRYQQAAPQPKEIRWYDSGHVLTAEAWCDAARFLGRQIGIAGSREPECGY
jgi:uncharacterized protein